MAANDRQVAGNHYGGGIYQHWDMVVEHKLNYFQGQITKYVMRAPKKNGKQDLEKARHFLDKYLEVYDLIHAEPTTIQVGVTPIEHVLRQYTDERFTIEGHAANGTALYKCRQCGQEAWAIGNYEAHLTHGSCAGGGYVAQG
jgi:hypothetical protein